MPDLLRCSAPARANLIGNPSDQYGGCTLACSIPLRARVELRAAERFSLESAGERAELRGAADLTPRGDALDLGRATLAHLGLEGSAAAIRYGSEIPRQSGIGGSTALLVALLRALLAWRGEEIAPAELAERAREVERRDLGVACGYVDPYLAVFGGLRFVDFRGKTPDGRFPDEPLATVESLEAPLPFVIADTGVRHSSDAVHRPLQARWRAGEPAVVLGYERVAELGRAGREALLAGDWPELGECMNENHAIQRGLGGSGEANEALIQAARRAGAPGAKLAGAGQGGTIVALWPEPDREPLERALRSAGAAVFHRLEPCEGVRLDEEADPTQEGSLS